MEFPPFSIGTHFKKKKKVTKKKGNSTSRNLQYYYGRQPPCTFEPYSGRRWRIPECLKLSESVKYKFSLLETLFSFIYSISYDLEA
jgi:hypothetical protein